MYKVKQIKEFSKESGYKINIIINGLYTNNDKTGETVDKKTPFN